MEGRDQRFRDLLASYASGRISRDAFDELFDRLCAEEQVSAADFAAIWDQAQSFDVPLGDKEMLFDRIRTDVRYKGAAVSRPVVRMYRRMAGVAVILLALATVAVLVFDADPNRRAGLDPVETAVQHPLAPGSNKAVLEWSGGRQLELADTEQGIAMANGTIAYRDGTALDESVVGNITKSTELVLRIPRGGQYRVAMDDGTVVWLNAGSTLRYPAEFTQANREVILEGEAFFEIAKDAERPFRVRAGETLIEVLGTRFNVSAYQDDNEWVATVAEGTVRVSREGSQVVLAKDQAAVMDVSAPGRLSVRQVSGERAMAWTTGLFSFDRDNIPEVMKRIGRWYDAEIVLQGDFSGKTLGGSVSRYESVEELLGVMAQTGQFTYKIEGRRILVMD